MRVVRETVIEVFNGLMDHGMVNQMILEIVKLVFGWEFTIDK
jgi:hypothetical protein